MNSTAWHTFLGQEERRTNSRTRKDGAGGDGGKVWTGRKGGRADRGTRYRALFLRHMRNGRIGGRERMRP